MSDASLCAIPSPPTSRARKCPRVPRSRPRRRSPDTAHSLASRHRGLLPDGCEAMVARGERPRRVDEGHLAPPADTAARAPDESARARQPRRRCRRWRRRRRGDRQAPAATRSPASAWYVRSPRYVAVRRRMPDIETVQSLGCRAHGRARACRRGAPTARRDDEDVRLLEQRVEFRPPRHRLEGRSSRRVALQKAPRTRPGPPRRGSRRRAVRPW
jgi:hypothetical protein